MAFQGKLAKWIISLMPPRETYCHFVEPYFGGGSVMLAMDPEGVSEVANDLHRDLTNFWNVIKHEHTFEAFRRVMLATPFSEVEFETARGLLSSLGFVGVPTEGDIPLASTGACVLRACNFFVVCRQAMAGRNKDFAPLSRNRTRRGMNEQASAWLTTVDGLPGVHARMRRVAILNRPALEVIEGQDGPKTLFYLDPPYHHDTRATTADYQHEMSHADHVALLATLERIQGRFLLSGYHSGLYDDWAARNGFRCEECPIVNNAAGGESKRTMTEVLWLNY